MLEQGEMLVKFTQKNVVPLWGAHIIFVYPLCPLHGQILDKTLSVRRGALLSLLCPKRTF